MFDKIIKNFRSEDKKRMDEIQIRLGVIVNEIGEILQNRSVNFYEMADILTELNARFNKNIFNALKQLQDQNKALKQKNNDLPKSK